MAIVTIYTTSICPYCIRAKYLLDSKKIDYTEISVDGNAGLRREMMIKSGQHTVPQIWVGDTHVGGCDELMTLARSGELDGLLSEEAEAASA